MPIYNNKVNKYFQFGKQGHKYYYTNNENKKIAYNKCLNQMRAIKYSQNNN